MSNNYLFACLSFMRIHLFAQHFFFFSRTASGADLVQGSIFKHFVFFFSVSNGLLAHGCWPKSCFLGRWNAWAFIQNCFVRKKRSFPIQKSEKNTSTLFLLVLRFPRLVSVRGTVSFLVIFTVTFIRR